AYHPAIERIGPRRSQSSNQSGLLPFRCMGCACPSTRGGSCAGAAPLPWRAGAGSRVGAEDARSRGEDDSGRTRPCCSSPCPRGRRLRHDQALLLKAGIVSMWLEEISNAVAVSGGYPDPRADPAGRWFLASVGRYGGQIPGACAARGAGNEGLPTRELGLLVTVTALRMDGKHILIFFEDAIPPQRRRPPGRPGEDDPSPDRKT